MRRKTSGRKKILEMIRGIALPGSVQLPFERDYGSTVRITYVMYVPRLDKNLVFVAVLEDHGYDVIFSKGKVFLRHIAMRQVK